MVFSFQKLRTFLAALANLVLISGYFFLRLSGILPEMVLVDAGVAVLAGFLMFIMPFFKKNRIAFRFDGWVFFLIFLPLLYIALSIAFEFMFDLDSYLPNIADFAEIIYAFLGYAFGYVFFEHTTVEYEKGKAQERSAKRQAKKERRKQKSKQKRNEREAARDSKNAEKASRNAQKANKEAAAAEKKLAKSTKKAAKA